ncbi:MAG TPA: hypothetical protein VF765_30060 [Polyangiaceae bacterium]
MRSVPPSQGPFDTEPGSGAETFQLKLRLAADAATGAYEVTIELLDVGVRVETIDVDLRRALRTAADECAERLNEMGYAVTSNDVIGALEEALDDAEVVQRESAPPN